MRLILKIIKLAIAALSVCVIVAWLVGQILSDRYTFSQWLLWIPTPFAIAFALVGSIALLPKKPANRLDKTQLACCICIPIAIVIYFALLEHHFLRGATNTHTSFKVIHFNTVTATDEELEHFISDVLAQNADLIVLTSPNRPKIFDALTESYKADGNTFVVRPFRIFSRHEILESRLIVSNLGITVVLLRIDTTSKLGKEITIYAVDLPSEPKISRMQTAQRLRAMLNDANAPLSDLVLGDFNMTRRGAALKTAFPNLVHAYAQAGTGYGATYPRKFPLFHIDHILLAQTLQAQTYQLINPQAGRHMLQIAEIRTKP